MDNDIKKLDHYLDEAAVEIIEKFRDYDDIPGREEVVELEVKYTNGSGEDDVVFLIITGHVSDYEHSKGDYYTPDSYSFQVTITSCVIALDNNEIETLIKPYIYYE
jgi:hypothetical protein